MKEYKFKSYNQESWILLKILIVKLKKLIVNISKNNN